jgi:hypothetical protein
VPEHVSLSLADIYARIAKPRALAKEHEEEASKLEAFKRLALGIGSLQAARPLEARIKSSLLGDPISAYREMGTKQAAIKYLKSKRNPAGATEISKALLAGGKQTVSKAFHRTVDNVLSHAAKKKVPEVRKINGKWALTDWGLGETPSRESGGRLGRK